MISIFLGGVVFLFAFSWFKEATNEILKKDFESAADDSKSHRSYLLKIFFFDWIISIVGVVFTGILLSLIHI